MKTLYLIYINKVGSTFKGENLFEFLFSDSTEWEWDENWYQSSVIMDKNDLTPSENVIKFIGSLRTEKFDLELLQDSGVFDLYNAVEGIVALGWEKFNDGGEGEYPENRLVFRFGETRESVDEKIYSMDLKLDYQQNKVKIF